MSPETPKSANSANILVIEDSESMQRMVTAMLQKAGHEVQCAETGTRGLEAAGEGWADLVVLDLGLPDIDGMQVCTELRKMSDVFVVMLTGANDDDTRYEGLATGADAYVTKPFTSRSLLVPIEVLLRRRSPTTPSQGTFAVGDLSIDTASHQVFVGESEVHLTKIERTIVECLATSAGTTMTRADLTTALWGPNWVGDDHGISVHIGNLRRKLRSMTGAKIETVRGVGYRLDALEPVAADVA